MQIITSNPIVRQLLESISLTVIENGGEAHSSLCVNHHAERLWLSCPSQFIGETLLRIPNNLFIPISQLNWTGHTGILEYSGNTSCLSAAQLQILDNMVELYNATDKLNQVTAHFPDAQFRQDTELFQLIKIARPNVELSTKSLAEQFICTRKSSQNNEDSEESNDYLMPLIDMLNHHPLGPKYGRNDAKDWIIQVQHPNVGSDECFVRYQKGDSFANALWHGYLERAPQYLSSVQCTFTHEVFGNIIVHGVNYECRKLNAPYVQRVDGGLELHSIILDPETLHSLRTFLGLAIRSVNREIEQPQAEQIAGGLIATIIEHNESYFRKLRDFCAEHQNIYALRPLFHAVAEHQLGILDNLKQLIKKTSAEYPHQSAEA